LYVGTDLGVYVSLDSGGSWQSLVADLPSTPVYDLTVHRREGELIAATHGRSLFLLDVRPIQAMSATVREAALTIFPIRPVRLTWRVRREVPPQPPRGIAMIHYWLSSAADVTVTIRSADGSAIRELTASGQPGVNVLEWDARGDNGRDTPPGTYEVEMVTAAGRATASVTLLPVEPR
jgi:hypothetical protein